MPPLHRRDHLNPVDLPSHRRRPTPCSYPRGTPLSGRFGGRFTATVSLGRDVRNSALLLGLVADWHPGHSAVGHPLGWSPTTSPRRASVGGLAEVGETGAGVRRRLSGLEVLVERPRR